MTRNRQRILVLALVAVWAGLSGSSACVGQKAALPAATNASHLVEVPQPDLAAVDAPVREQIRKSRAALAAVTSQKDIPRGRMAAAYGELGQIYQAYGFDDAALACYRNSAQIDSRAFNWPYLQGYLHQKNGFADDAEREYKRALALNPRYNPALLRMGALELTLAKPDAAREYFTQAMAAQSSAAALSGLGKAALAEHQYSAAVINFKAALALDPKASSLHYQLAMAYRGLGDLAHVQEQLRARGNVEPEIEDPLLDRISLLKQGKLSLVQRGGAALREGRFADAVTSYRQLVELAPADPLAYEYLGVALARQGKTGEALKAYAHALQLDPKSAPAHYDIGILLIQERREQEAIAQFRQAGQLDPGEVSAHFQLANLLMRAGRDVEAEKEYGAVVALDPRNEFARFMQAMAAVHRGDYAGARTLLENAAASLPDDADIANALARVLSAAPDATVRDPARALRIVASLVRNQRGDPLEAGTTLAMALAAVGQYQQAATYQQAVIAQLEAAHQDAEARSLRQNLVRYQQGKTCAAPWASDDPIFKPVPGKLQLSVEGKTPDTHP